MHVMEGTRGEIQPVKLDQTMYTQMPLNTSNYGKQQRKENLNPEERAMRRTRMARKSKRRKGKRNTATPLILEKGHVVLVQSVGFCTRRGMVMQRQRMMLTSLSIRNNWLR